ncbi:PAC2 family protein [Actinocrinis puniceicyclus]|uniref:PAC2 family protein n=1 Tax=Actinocrinis puniceicyclus TaxID=977794 RepID=A0A8J7WK53_9ACTN|nr:PAC2 family protein [Actinocrinis puniceicyclus]MBS2961617.1 PAC2 family protein [Actinocrinis puniceicyclus]
MIELEELPELVDPVMVAAFEGWNDAADAASNAVRHLAEVLDADLFGAMDAEEYYDFQVNRPVLALDDDGEREIVWPTTRFSVARVRIASAQAESAQPEPHAPDPAGVQQNDEAGETTGLRDVVLVHGIEPNMRWRSFCEELFDLARDLGVRTIVTLGALLADVPHTRPVPVSGSSNNDELQGAHGLDKPTLQGPTGINGVMQEMARQEEIDLVSFWAAVPHYVAQAPCPKATLALIRRIEDVLDLTIPLGDLPEEARAWESGVDELAAEDSEVAEYVRTLEEAKDTAELPEASGEAIAREFERYLRRHERRRRGGSAEDGPA